MKLLRFVFPFLFFRNWYTGEWELSRVRVFLFLGAIALCIVGLIMIYILQMPVTYTASVSS